MSMNDRHRAPSRPRPRPHAGGGWAVWCALIALAVTSHGTAGTNLLFNPGFELDASGQATSLRGWQTFSPNNYSQTGAAQAHSGSNYFKIYQAFTGAVNFTGIYQDQVSGPGAAYAAGGWAFTSTSDTLAGQNAAWVELTFRDPAGNILALYRSAVVTTNQLRSGAFPRGAWVYLPVTNQYNPSTYLITNTVSTLTAPPGTSYARFQLTFQGDAANSLGSVYFDDLSLVPVSGASWGDWNLVWNDEFNGSTLNPQVWTFDTGGGGWGNNELECYTSRAVNAYVGGGLLHLVARAEAYGGENYTSARIKTQGLYTRKYGRFEFRARLSAGGALWPALWLLGADISSAGWPACGEIDVMESSGYAPGNVQGSLHSGSDETAVYALPDNSATNFHTYLLEWSTNAINWFVDGIRYETQTGWASSIGAYPAPFNQPFFLILNLAVGGNYVGNPSQAAVNSTTSFPSEFQVDYVRIYDHTAPLQLSVTRASGGVWLSWPGNVVCHLQTQAGSPAATWTDLLGGSNPRFVPGTDQSGFFRLVSP